VVLEVYAALNDPSPQGLAAAYAEHRAQLLRFLIARTGQPADAEELLQEVWLKIGAARTGPIADARAYLYRVAQNLALDRLREMKRRAVRERDWADVTLDQRADAPEPAATVDAESALIAAGEAQRLADAIARLPPGAGRAFRLHKLDGLSHAEVALRMGISRKGVEGHMATAMTHLRRLLAEKDLG